MTHEDILTTLSECICDADEKQAYATGDRLFDVIIALKQEWGLDDDESPEREPREDDWKTWGVGDKLLYRGDDFDGAWKYTCTVMKKLDGRLLAYEETVPMHLTVNENTKDLFRKIKEK